MSKILKSYEITVTVYELEDDFYAEVSENDQGVSFYLGHKDYGIKTLMFSFGIDNAPLYENIIAANVADYIDMYKAEVMADG